MGHGKRHDLNARLRQVGLRQLIQTAFIERVNLTFCQSIAALACDTWAYARSEQRLNLHCQWFRAYYHFVRPHESLRSPVPGFRGRYHNRTPTIVLGLTDHIWQVKDLLHRVVQQVA